MKYIKKSHTTPIAFTRAVLGAAGYKSLYSSQKQEMLTKVLLPEQQSFCVYCQQSISPAQATLEHLLCQSHNKHADLLYHNLFAVCQGNEGIVQQSHCDKFRANGADNDYFPPFMLFESCQTMGWDSLNPFFDVEFSAKTGVISGKLLAREGKIPGYPATKPFIEKAIDNILNLNAPVLKHARQEKWALIEAEQKHTGMSWQDLFARYLTRPTDFNEFVLLAIRKQVP